MKHHSCSVALWAAMAVSACGGRYKPSEPIPAIPEACCTQGDEELQHFRGCRPTGRCKQGEPYWLRGAITCTPIDETNCDGARCCEYMKRHGLDEDKQAPDASATESDASSDPETDASSDPETDASSDSEPAPTVPASESESDGSASGPAPEPQ